MYLPHDGMSERLGREHPTTRDCTFTNGNTVNPILTSESSNRHICHNTGGRYRAAYQKGRRRLPVIRNDDSRAIAQFA